MSIVFVTQESPGKNLIPAQAFGELQFLFDARKQVMMSPGPAINELKHKLRNFSSQDYLLLLGDPILIAAAVNVAAQMNHNKVKVLKWDKQEMTYYPLQLQF